MQVKSGRKRAGVAAVSLCLLAQCNTDEPEVTELLLQILSEVRVSSVEIRVRNIDYDEDSLTTTLSRDITVEALELLIRPSSIIQDDFLVHVRGFDGGSQLAAAAAVYTFVPNRRVTERMVLRNYIDADGDGFEACNREGCDCADQNPNINPFTKEACGDRVDNNCSGRPADEGCPCRIGDPPIACTRLPEPLLSLAGIGACTLGELNCVNDPDGDGFGVLETECNSGTFSAEVPGNQIDDDCDGTVDEGSICAVGAQRPCFLGRINAEATALVPAGSECSLGTQRCIDGPIDGPEWGPCENEVPPTRDPPPGVGFSERGLGSDGCDLCDGKDNDCDGLVDEEPDFDVDGDGYTLCGTEIRNGGIPTNPADKEHALLADFIDCDDSDPAINPGAVERCGNAINEDCRCDHGDPSTQIGRPYNNVVPDCNSPPPTNCTQVQSYLNCFVYPRSDPTTPGECYDGPDPYYYGYVGPSATDRDCHYCDERFGEGCNSVTGACTTKPEDCTDCSQGPSPPAPLSRPLCTTPGAGCSDDQAPVWTPIVGSDPNNECGFVSCAPYFHSLSGGFCYEKEDQQANEVDCKSAGACETAADLCSVETVAKGTPVPPPSLCQRVVGGCSGTTAPVWDDQPNSMDLFGQCNDNYNCGSYFHGIRDPTPTDTKANLFCYHKADVSNSSCDGTGDCQSEAEACSASSEGSVAAGLPVCQTPTGGCSGTTGPTYGSVTRSTDPYDHCAGVQTCDGNGACHQQPGGPCASGLVCETELGFSLTCLHGVCCRASSCGTCQRCDQSVDGTCATVPNGTDVNGDCGNYYCASGSCDTSCSPNDDNQCKPGAHCDTSTCNPDHGLGAACEGPQDCTSGNCVDGVCCNSACTGTCQACVSAKTGGSDGTCANIPSLNDPDNECGNYFCLSGGGCDSSCASNDDNQCKPAAHCDGSTCATDHGPGLPCGGLQDCQSGYCVDGVCCNSACTDTCWACSAAKTGGADGTCAAVSNGTDPENECSGGAACKNGVCSTGCTGCVDTDDCQATYYCATGVCTAQLGNGSTPDACGSASCASSNVADGVCCNSACTGTCRACVSTKTGGSDGTCANIPSGSDPDSECGNYYCLSSGGCDSSCASNQDTQCKAAAHCDGSACNLDHDLGAVCEGAQDCLSTNCVDGVCCNVASCPACYNCSAPSGTCVAAYTGADDDGCTGTDTYCCAGTCVNPSPTPSEYGAACGTGDCAGNWICSGSVGECSQAGTECDSCTNDTIVNGLCSSASGSACAPTGINVDCPKCQRCNDTAKSLSCTNYGLNVDDTTNPNQCVNSSDCSTSDCTCNGGGLCLGPTSATGCGSDGTLCVSGTCSSNTCQ